MHADMLTSFNLLVVEKVIEKNLTLLEKLREVNIIERTMMVQQILKLKKKFIVKNLKMKAGQVKISYKMMKLRKT